MRKKIIAGNWKMNNTLDSAMSLATKINEERSSFPDNVQVIIAPPSLFMGNLLLMHDPAFDLAAQNCNQHDFGAFTGEISPAMLHSMSIPYCIIGHSERRTYYHETDEILKQKIAACIRNHVKPIFCIGESLEERQSGIHFEVLHKQIANALITPEKDQLKGTCDRLRTGLGNRNRSYSEL
jgi:triosephosphate isomerase